jgi:hypothetical protein
MLLYAGGWKSTFSFAAFGAWVCTTRGIEVKIFPGCLRRAGHSSQFSFGAFGAQGSEVKFFRWRLRRANTEVTIFLFRLRRAGR